VPTNLYVLVDPRAPTEYRYVGITNQLKKRLNNHIWSSKMGKKTYKCNWIRSLFNVGITPKIIVKAIIEDSMRSDMEIKYILKLKTLGYRLTNTTDGGDGGQLGGVPWNKGKNMPLHIRNKISKSLMGKLNPMYGRSQLGKLNPMYGKKHTIESIEKNRKSHIGLQAGYNNPRFDYNIYTFKNINGTTFVGYQYDFKKIYNLISSKITRLIHKQIKSYKGWVLQ